jgi:metal-responsive CopG/Arc/MetJ family transcriptional regulator
MRRRSQNKTIAISITLDRSIIDELDEILSAKQSRSKFIQRCIEQKLNGTNTILESTTRQLMAALTSREDCDPFLKKLLMQILLS